MKVLLRACNVSCCLCRLLWEGGTTLISALVSHHRLSEGLTHLHSQSICAVSEPITGTVEADIHILQNSDRVPLTHTALHFGCKTTGPPVSARGRHLVPNCLHVAQQEFDHMLELGRRAIIQQPST